MLYLYDGLLTAIQAVVMSRKSVGGEWLKYSLHVISRYKFPARRESRSSSSSSSQAAAAAGADMTYRRLDNAWTHVDDVTCDCPRLSVRKTYLLVGWSHGRGRSRHSGLVLGPDSLVMPWRSSWSRRLKRLARFQQSGGC